MQFCSWNMSLVFVRKTNKPVSSLNSLVNLEFILDTFCLVFRPCFKLEQIDKTNDLIRKEKKIKQTAFFLNQKFWHFCFRNELIHNVYNITTTLASPLTVLLCPIVNRIHFESYTICNIVYVPNWQLSSLHKWIIKSKW